LICSTSLSTTRTQGDFAADIGQQNIARRPFDQGHAKLVLELPDLRRQGRLTDEARFGGAAEMYAFEEGIQRAEITQKHTAGPLSITIERIVSINWID
jgi:hypothetical protein